MTSIAPTLTSALAPAPLAWLASLCLYGASTAAPALVPRATSAPIAGLSTQATASTPTEAPPNAVFVPGGKTRIGMDVKDVLRLIQNDDGTANYAGALISETPHQDLFVDGFFLTTTEVTQEQYGEYVKAVGAYPLESWCESAIAEAARAFAESEQRAEEEARTRGVPAPARRVFDRREWWASNASQTAWSIPPEDRLRPAVFVDYAAARAYARWSGMRLPTEFEFQRAVRGDSGQTYPWGNDWDNEKYAATSLLRKKGGTFPVGSFPAGRNRQGICDLAGNVWEWTSSPYTAYPGYTLKVFEVGYGNLRRWVNAVADFNPEQRVVVGGSFQQPNLMCRGSTRRGTARDQKTGAIGFRCAASVRPGTDLAQYVLDDDYDVQLRPRIDGVMVEFAPAAALCVDAWRSVEPATPPAGQTLPERYTVVSDYRYVLFTPVAQIPAPDAQTFEKRSLDEPVPLGILTANVAILEPDLPAGSYLLSYRARGVRRLGTTRPVDPARPAVAPIEETLKLDPAFDHVIVTTLRGDPVTALRRRVEYVAERDSRMSSAPIVNGSDGATTTATTDGLPTSRVITVDACLPCRTTKRGFGLQFELRTAPTDDSLRWRR